MEFNPSEDGREEISEANSNGSNVLKVTMGRKYCWHCTIKGSELELRKRNLWNWNCGEVAGVDNAKV